MTNQMREDFPRFLREHVRPVLRQRGYRFSGQTAKKTLGPATAHLSIMRYTSSFRGHFDVRMALTLDPYYLKDLGVVVAQDLSIQTYGSVAAAPWHWPVPPPAWPTLAATLLPALVTGAGWIESFLNLQLLADHLERERRFSPQADAEAVALLSRMKAVGITTQYESPGFGKPRAGTIRPDKVKALSYCYELLGDWSGALGAWDDYLTTFTNAGPDHPAVREARDRRVYLVGKGVAVQQGDEADER